MKIWKIAQANGSFTGWILPSGRIADAKNYGHEDYVRTYPTEFNISDQEYENMQEIGEYELAFKHGAVRMSIFQERMSIEGELISIKKFTETIHKLAKRFGVIEIFCQLGNGFKRMPVEGLYNL